MSTPPKGQLLDARHMGVLMVDNLRQIPMFSTVTRPRRYLRMSYMWCLCVRNRCDVGCVGGCCVRAEGALNRKQAVCNSSRGIRNRQCHSFQARKGMRNAAFRSLTRRGWLEARSRAARWSWTKLSTVRHRPVSRCDKCEIKRAK